MTPSEQMRGAKHPRWSGFWRGLVRVWGFCPADPYWVVPQGTAPPGYVDHRETECPTCGARPGAECTIGEGAFKRPLPPGRVHWHRPAPSDPKEGAGA